MRHKNRVFVNLGFSLAEALMVMFIVCAVVAFATPALTKLVKKKNQQISHGSYACYYDGSTLKQWYTGKVEETVTECLFKLNTRDNAYYLIKAVGGGNSSAPGQYVSTYIPRSDSELKITVGRANQTSNSTADTVVASQMTKFGTGGSYEELLRALGSVGSTGLLYGGNTDSCTLRDAPPQCNKGEQSDCRVAKNPSSGVLSFKVRICDKEEYVPIQASGNGITENTNVPDVNNTNKKIERGAYKKTSGTTGNREMAIKFKDTSFPNSKTSAVSGLMEEIGNSPTEKMLEKLKSLAVGNKSKNGAVLIQW